RRRVVPLIGAGALGHQPQPRIRAHPVMSAHESSTDSLGLPLDSRHKEHAMTRRPEAVFVLLVAALLAICVIASSPGSAQGPEQLVVTSWGGNLQEVQRVVYFQPFVKETGIKLVEDEWGGEMAKLRAMVQSGSPTWDVVEV